MSATIQFTPGITATATHYRWDCANPRVLRLLNMLLRPRGPAGSDPNPDYTLALEAQKRFGCKIIRWDKTQSTEISPPSESVDAAVTPATKSYPAPHRGRVGKRGGSLPRDGSAPAAPVSVTRGRNLRAYDVIAGDAAAYTDALTFADPEGQALLTQYHLTAKQLRAKIMEARRLASTVTPTRDKYFQDGAYTPERQALHDRIVADLLRQGTPVAAGTQPTVVITGGYPGSGKSTMMASPEYADIREKGVHLDSDWICAELAKADGGGIGWKGGGYQTEADDVQTRVLVGVVQQRNPLILEGTLKTAGKCTSLVAALKEHGYRVEVAYADIPMRTAITRCVSRWLHTGRFVDPAYVATHNHRNLQTLEILKTQADAWRVWDTSATGQPARLKASGGHNA